MTLNVGQYSTVNINVKPENAAKKDNLIWESLNNEIATVDENGKVTAVAEGETEIIVRTLDENEANAICKVNVKKSEPQEQSDVEQKDEINNVLVTQLELIPTSLTLTEGKTKKLEIKVIPNYATNKNVTWKSSNSKIAKIDKNGNVTAVKKGNVTITAISKDGSGKKAIATIKVIANVTNEVTNKKECNHPTRKQVNINPRNPHGSSGHEIGIMCNKCKKVIKTELEEHHYGEWEKVQETKCYEKRVRKCECGYFESDIKRKATEHIRI